MDDIVYLGTPPEPCRKVRDFGELREGMVVYLDCCAHHRGIAIGPTETKKHGLIFTILPTPSSCRFPTRGLVPAAAVDLGYVYAVVDTRLEGETKSRTKSKAKPKETVDR